MSSGDLREADAAVTHTGAPDAPAASRRDGVPAGALSTEEERPDVETTMARARRAQAEVEFWPQDRVDDLVAALGWAAYQEDTARSLADLAYRETGLGDPEHLFTLYRRRVLGTLRDLHGVVTSGIIEELPERGLRKLAKPIGVIAVASPATAPCSGVVGNALPMLKTRNAVVITPNPRARHSAARTVELLRRALETVGAPADLVQCLPVTDRQTTEALMAAADLVIAAGGPGTVRRAYRSGTPAISAGVGNPAVIVDASADVAAAAELIVLGGSFNNGTSCSSESNVLVDAGIAAAFRDQLARQGAHLCDPAETARLRTLLWPDGRLLNRDAVGRPAAALAAAAGIDLAEPTKTTALVAQLPPLAPGGVPALDDPMLGEKLAPVFTVSTFTAFDDALAAVEALLGRIGQGHSCGIHTERPDRVVRLAERARAGRVMVNQSTAVGNSGSFDNGMPFTQVIASGSWGGCSRSENVTWRDFLNYTYVSHPLPASLPDEETLFGAHWRRLP
ncbi:aldehyde dehydrogenase family protein [Micromonospora sp. NPDC047812]|uniref:aldehyde dehydrogenase family protein n=1 Tax=Micromonospora sp. NPDC047812 TaxID=3155742 RepID=UPI003454205A